MKRKLCAGLLLAALLVTLCPAGAAVNSVIFVSVNDDLLDLGLYTPISSGSTVYLPASVFSGSLGIVFSHNVASKTASLYTAARTLYFDLTDYFSYDTQGNFFETGAMLRDGRVYVPLDFICSYFGLTYSWTPVEYGTLFRLTNSSAVLSDEVFISAAEQSMRRRYNAWAEANREPEVPPETEPTTPSTPEPPSRMTARLCLQGPLNAGTEALLDRLDELGIPCVFFTDAASLQAQPQLARRILCSGHGLAAAGADAAAAAAFNAELDRQLLTKTRLVLCSPEQSESLRALGFAPCAADLQPDLTAEEPLTAQEIAVRLRTLAFQEGRSVSLLLPATESAGDLAAELMVELGSSCLWALTTEVTADP